MTRRVDNDDADLALFEKVTRDMERRYKRKIEKLERELDLASRPPVVDGTGQHWHPTRVFVALAVGVVLTAAVVALVVALLTRGVTINIARDEPATISQTEDPEAVEPEVVGLPQLTLPFSPEATSEPPPEPGPEPVVIVEDGVAREPDPAPAPPPQPEPAPEPEPEPAPEPEPEPEPDPIVPDPPPDPGPPEVPIEPAEEDPGVLEVVLDGVGGIVGGVVRALL